MRAPAKTPKDAAAREHALAALVHTRAAYRAVESAEAALRGTERDAARMVCLELAGAGQRLRKLALVVGVSPSDLEERRT